MSAPGPDMERNNVSETASISASIADRYATAVFELARDANAIDALQADVKTLDEAVEGSDALRDLLHSPLYKREEQEAAVAALTSKMGLGETLANTLRLMALKGRLFAVPQLLSTLEARIAEAKGIVTAEVTTAKALTKGQSEKLSKVLSAKVGQDIEIKTTVDEDIIGGLIVKLGSKMIDTSIRSKLGALKNTMKEVG